MSSRQTTYDAVIIGAGASGGWAAKRLTEAGLTVALVDAGRPHASSDFREHVRAFDLSDPFRPAEVAHAVPPAPRKSPKKAVQLNDVFVDDRGVLFTVDRMIGGLYAYELKV